jgi:RpiR family carbohydrate utilization transcriptional regulator
VNPAELLRAIDTARAGLRKSERKVAEQVLADPARVVSMRIVDLAAAAGVSEPTVVRFCQAVGCRGFLEFRLALAQQLAASRGAGTVAVTDTDSVREYTDKVFNATADSLIEVRDSLDPRMLERAIQALCAARRVEFYGFGASAPVAFDAQHRFFRLRLVTAAYSDPHLQNMSATSLEPGDVVVALSQSGRTRALLESMARVQERGALVIGLAPSGTPVATGADIPIAIDVREDIQLYTPLSSRIAHLVVIDVLAIGVAQRKGAGLEEHLPRLQEGLRSLRMD